MASGLRNPASHVRAAGAEGTLMSRVPYVVLLLSLLATACSVDPSSVAVGVKFTDLEAIDPEAAAEPAVGIDAAAATLPPAQPVPAATEPTVVVEAELAAPAEPSPEALWDSMILERYERIDQDSLDLFEFGRLAASYCSEMTDYHLAGPSE